MRGLAIDAHVPEVERRPPVGVDEFDCPAGDRHVAEAPSILGAIALYFLDMIEPMSSRVAIHLIVTIGIAAALVRFGMLERRVHSLG